MQRATTPSPMPMRPRMAGRHRLASSAVAAAGGKRPPKQKSGGGGGSGAARAPPPPPSPLPPGVRAEGELSDRERALLEAALRDSQQQQPQQQAARKARAPAAAKKGFAAGSAVAAAASASAATTTPPPAAPPPPPAARAIDPREAARGRVELVNVRSWGAAGEAGDLEVVSMRTLVGGGDEQKKKTRMPGQQQQQQQQQAGGGEDGQATPAPPPPLHVALAQQLQLAEARGALSIASSATSKPLPPFEQWSFSPRSYAQYLADHAEAHAALDDAVGAAAASASASAPAPAAGSAAEEAATTTTTPAQRAARCLRWFARERGIARGDAYASDLRVLVASLGEGEQQHQAPAPPAPSNGAAALARLLRRLGRDAAVAAGGRDGDDDGGEAALKLAAHAYALRAAHLSGSGRITAAAEGRLGLARRGALAAVARYGLPVAAAEAGSSSSSSLSPPAAFSADVDAYGRDMMEGQTSDDGGGAEPYAWAAPMFAELPSAFRKASALLDGLATGE